MLGFSHYYALALEAKAKRPTYMFSANRLAEYLFDRAYAGDLEQLLKSLDKKYKRYG